MVDYSYSKIKFVLIVDYFWVLLLLDEKKIQNAVNNPIAPMGNNFIPNVSKNRGL